LIDRNAGRPFSQGAQGLACDAVPLVRLARQHGTPLYVYSWSAIAGRFHALHAAFGAREQLAQSTICYAVKANSNLTILRKLAGLGAGFDIVSGGELERVRMAAPGALSRVVFSGVGKTAQEMDAALDADILLFNVESEAEIQLLAARARSRRKKARFALRVNPDVFADTHPYISTGLTEHKFGVPIAKARELYRTAAKSKWLVPVGVSVHIGSQIRSASPFGDAVARVARLVGQLRADGIAIQYVDAGGGLGVDYDPANRFDEAEHAATYAAAVSKAWTGEPVHWLFEPGRFLVAHAGCLLTRVLFVKENGRKTFLIVDAGMNDLIRPALYDAKHAIEPVAPRAGRAQVCDVVGPVCETGDFFARDRKLPPVQPGDLLAVLDAGAYGMSLSSNYNARARPAEVLVDGKKATVIRRREQLTDLTGPESEMLG
jgi:diaminopimelate decarboxylase